MEDYDLLLLCMAQDGSLSPGMAKCDLVWLYISENSPAWEFVIECEYGKYGQEEPSMACQSMAEYIQFTSLYPSTAVGVLVGRSAPIEVSQLDTMPLDF